MLFLHFFFQHLFPEQVLNVEEQLANGMKALDFKAFERVPSCLLFVDTQ